MLQVKPIVPKSALPINFPQLSEKEMLNKYHKRCCRIGKTAKDHRKRGRPEELATK